MFQYYQPTATHLTITVGNTYRPVNRVALHVGTRNALEAVAEPNAAIYGDAETSNSNFRCTLEVREEFHPIPSICVSAEVFLSRHYIKNDETIARYIALHHRVNISGVEGRCKPFLKRPDGCFAEPYLFTNRYINSSSR